MVETKNAHGKIIFFNISLKPFISEKKKEQKKKEKKEEKKLILKIY